MQIIPSARQRPLVESESKLTKRGLAGGGLLANRSIYQLPRASTCCSCCIFDQSRKGTTRKNDAKHQHRKVSLSFASPYKSNYAVY